VLLFVVCTGVLVAVSLLTEPPPAARTAGLTYQRGTAIVKDRPRSLRLSVVLSVLLVALLGALWVVFA